MRITSVEGSKNMSLHQSTIRDYSTQIDISRHYRCQSYLALSFVNAGPILGNIDITKVLFYCDLQKILLVHAACYDSDAYNDVLELL